MYEKDLNAAARPAQSRRIRRIISDENGEGCGGRKVVAVAVKLDLARARNSNQTCNCGVSY